MAPVTSVRGRRTAEAWRVAAVAVLLAVMAAGLRARGVVSTGSNLTTLGASGPALATALYAAEGVAFVAFIIVLASARPQRRSKGDETEPPRPALPWWAKTLGVLLAVAAMITPFVVLLTQHARKTPVRSLPGGPGGAGEPGRRPRRADRRRGAPGGDHRVLRGDGARIHGRRIAAGRRRHPGRGADQGDQGRDRQVWAG